MPTWAAITLGACGATAALALLTLTMLRTFRRGYKRGYARGRDDMKAFAINELKDAELRKQRRQAPTE